MESQDPIARDATKRRRGPLFVIVGVAAAVALCVGAIGVVQAVDVAQREEARADSPDRYAEVADLLTSSMSPVGEVHENLSAAEAEVEFAKHVVRLQTHAAESRDLAQHAQRQLDIFAKGQRLAESRPSLGDLFTGVCYAALGIATQHDQLLASGGKQSIDSVADIGDHVSEILQLRHATHVNALSFAEWAPERFSGPVANGPLFAATFRGPADGLIDAMRGRDNDEQLLVIENVSGGDLDDCFVIVRLKNDAGETFKNVHFVRNWEKGQKRYATYEDTWLFPRTVDEPTSLTIRVFARQQSSPTFTIRPGAFGW